MDAKFYRKNQEIRIRVITIFASIVISAIIVDVMLSMSIDVLDKQLVSMYGVILFVGVTAAIYIPSLYLLLTFVNTASKDIRIRSTYFKITYKAVVIAQIVIGGILLVTVLQIVLTREYSIGLLIASTAISFTLATIIMLMFSYRFFSWFRSSTYQKRKEKKHTLLWYYYYFMVLLVRLPEYLLEHMTLLSIV